MAVATNAVAGDTYMELINEFPLRRIRTAAAHARMIGVLQSILSEMLSGKRNWGKIAIRGLASHLTFKADRFLS
jgi:hypothetical protein